MKKGVLAFVQKLYQPSYRFNAAAAIFQRLTNSACLAASCSELCSNGLRIPSTADEVFTDTQSCASRLERLFIRADLLGNGIFVLSGIVLLSYRAVQFFIQEFRINEC